MREYFMQSERMGFSIWKESDTWLARSLWGEKEVTRYICTTGEFADEDIINRLHIEIENNKKYLIQYWPVFELTTGELIGCCGLRPYKEEQEIYELGIHLRKEFWGKGLASEGAKIVIRYCFETLKAKKIFVGHHPNNTASKKLLAKLGFDYIGENFYEPTGLYHPSYEMNKVLYTERLEIKPYQDLDEQEMVELLRNDEIKKSFMIPDWTLEQTIEKFQTLKVNSKSKDHFERGIYLDSKLIGFVNDVEIDGTTIEIGYVIHPNYQKCGYATEMLKTVISELFSIGYSKVITGAFDDNIASIKVMQYCEMKKDTKEDEIKYHGEIHHCVYYVKEN